MTIKTIKDLMPDSHNANKGTVRGAKMIEASLQQDGFGRPVLVDKNGQLIAGNKTVQGVADTFGIDTEVVLVKTTGNKVIVHQREDLDLDLESDDLNNPARRLAYRDNLAGHFSFELAPEVVLADFEGGFDFDDIGVKVEDLAVLLPDVTEFGENGEGGQDTEPQIDKAEELRVKWGVELGQLWQLGEHRIVCGDCTDPAVVERVMGGEEADCTATDPPFNVREDEWDKFDDFLSFTRQWLSLAKVHSVTIAAFFADKYLPLLAKAAELEDLPFRRSLIWVKPPGSQFAGGQKDCFWYDFELIQVYGGSIDIDGKTRFSVFDYRTITGQEHGAEKPIALYSDIWQNYSNEGGVIFEPFSGTGSNIIACENLSRRCRAIELDPGYVAVSIQRWADHTGKTPVLIES